MPDNVKESKWEALAYKAVCAVVALALTTAAVVINQKFGVPIPAFDL